MDLSLLCVIGIGVAGYLAHIETSQTNAICGPVGDYQLFQARCSRSTNLSRAFCHRSYLCMVFDLCDFDNNTDDSQHHISQSVT